MAKDPLAKALDDVTKSNATAQGKIQALYGHRPDVLDSILRARKERRLSYAQIARVLSTENDDSVSSSAVQTWLQTQGVE